MAFKAPRTIESFSAGEGFDEQTSQRPNKLQKRGLAQNGRHQRKRGIFDRLGLAPGAVVTLLFKGLLRLDIGFGRNVPHFSSLDADAFEKRADTTFTALDTGSVRGFLPPLL